MTVVGFKDTKYLFYDFQNQALPEFLSFNPLLNPTIRYSVFIIYATPTDFFVFFTHHPPSNCVMPCHFPHPSFLSPFYYNDIRYLNN
jgi:hypothetical protein